MSYLLASIACSIGTAMLLKVVEIREVDRLQVLAVNYTAGFLLAAALSTLRVLELPAGALALGAFTGAIFLAGYFVFGVAIRRAGVGLSTAVMRLSVAVPVLGSWALFGEVPTATQVVGLLLAGCAFFLLARPAAPAPEPAVAGYLGASLLLLLVFIAGGTADLSMKVFARTFGGSVAGAAFLVPVFGVAAVLAAGLSALRRFRPRVRGAAVQIGVVLGVVNYGSADFIIRAAAVMPAALVFPTLAIAVLAGTAVLALVVWNERLSRVNLVGIFLAAGALALLWSAGSAG